MFERGLMTKRRANPWAQWFSCFIHASELAYETPPGNLRRVGTTARVEIARCGWTLTSACHPLTTPPLENRPSNAQSTTRLIRVLHQHGHLWGMWCDWSGAQHPPG